MLAQIMVDEKRIMRVNVLRMQSVHTWLGKTAVAEFLPNTLAEFDENTKWTHVLSARFILCVNCFSVLRIISVMSLVGLQLGWQRTE